MSYAIHPYAVSLEKVRQTIGSGDEALVRTLTRKYQDDFAELDELDDEAPPMTQVLGVLVGGKKLDGLPGYKCGYALKALCERLGEWLTNRHWASLRWDWLEAVDAALDKYKVDAKLLRVQKQLTTRGSPIPIPRIDDFPSIGYLTAAEIGPVAAELAKLDRVKWDEEEIGESIAELRGWLDHCARTHSDLVCFYH